MSMKEISSRDNQWVKLACSLKQKKGRLAAQRFFVEGWRILEDAAAVGVTDAICFVSPKARANPVFSALWQQGQTLGWDFFAVPDHVYDKIKDTKSPQGLAGMLPFLPHTMDSLQHIDDKQPIVYLESIQDPGNLGTIIRTAAAANAGAVLLSGDSVDVYNDKTIRSAMGAIFKIPIIQAVTREALETYGRQSGRLLLGTTPAGSCSYAAAPYDKPVILAFGNEGNGLSADFLAHCDALITIPMRKDTESLNLSQSVGIVLYKAWEMNGFRA